MLRFSINAISHTHKVSQNATHMMPDKIKVLRCVGYPDCTYIETVQISFYPCDSRGAINGLDEEKRIIVTFDIETGYCPFSQVAETMRHGFRHLRIVGLDELIKAFEYRRYYCKI